MVMATGKLEKPIKLLLIPFSESYSIAANGNLMVNITATIPSGYQRLCIVGVWSGNTNCLIRGFDYNAIGLRNISSSAVNATLTGNIMCIAET